GRRGTGRGGRTARPGEDARLGGAPWRRPCLIQHDSVGQERLRRLTAPDGPRPHPLGARRLDHVTVAVYDLAAGLRAYSLAYGLEPDEEAQDPMLRARTVRLPLPRAPSSSPRPWRATARWPADLRRREKASSASP